VGARRRCLISATCHNHAVAVQVCGCGYFLSMTSKKIGGRCSQHAMLAAPQLEVLDISRNQRVRAVAVRDLEER